MVWVPDEHCNARFSDLFDNPEDVFDHFEPAEFSGPNFVTFDYMDPSVKYTLIEDGPENIYVRSAYLLNMTQGFEVGQTFNSSFSCLNLVDPSFNRPTVESYVNCRTFCLYTRRVS